MQTSEKPSFNACIDFCEQNRLCVASVWMDNGSDICSSYYMAGDVCAITSDLIFQRNIFASGEAPDPDAPRTICLGRTRKECGSVRFLQN